MTFIGKKIVLYSSEYIDSGGTMIPLLAKQSVQTKMDLRKSKILGNYEYYYGAGLLTGALGLQLQPTCAPLDIREAMQGVTEKADRSRERLHYLAVIMEGFYCSEERDDQMTELFEMGLKDSTKPDCI